MRDKLLTVWFVTEKTFLIKKRSRTQRFGLLHVEEFFQSNVLLTLKKMVKSIQQGCLYFFTWGICNTKFFKPKCSADSNYDLVFLLYGTISDREVLLRSRNTKKNSYKDSALYFCKVMLCNNNKKVPPFFVVLSRSQEVHKESLHALTVQTFILNSLEILSCLFNIWENDRKNKKCFSRVFFP